MTTTAALTVATASPLGDAPLPQVQASAGAAPGAAAVPAGEEVLSVAELLRLLEQNGGFAQALATAAADGSTGAAAATPASAARTAPAPAPAAPAAAAPAPRAAGQAGNDDGPCDIVTLLRILESQVQPAATAPAAASVTAAPAGKRPAAANQTEATTGTTSADTATLAAAAVALPLPIVVPAEVVAAADAGGSCAAGTASRLQAAGQGGEPDMTAAASGGANGGADAAVHRGGPGAPGAPPPVAPGGIDALIAAADGAVAPVSASAPAADSPGRDASTARVPDAPQAPADPARVTLSLAQTFRAEAPASAPVERAIHVPVRDPAWPQAVAAEIHFLADRQIEAATLRLSPEHLGPVEVRIDVRDNNVSVTFGVAHGDTQAALEQALPRLREMFAAAGLNLGQASVQQEARRGPHNGGESAAAGEAAGDTGDGTRPGTVRGVGLVDEYA